MFIYPSEYHRTIDGLALTRARESCRLTQEQLAVRCGWSRTQQVRLERPGRHEVRLQIAEALTMGLAMCQNRDIPTRQLTGGAEDDTLKGDGHQKDKDKDKAATGTKAGPQQ